MLLVGKCPVALRNSNASEFDDCNIGQIDMLHDYYQESEMLLLCKATRRRCQWSGKTLINSQKSFNERHELPHSGSLIECLLVSQILRFLHLEAFTDHIYPGENFRSRWSY